MKLLRAFIYPVKSLRGVEVPSLTLDARGPVGDRRWMVVDPRGVFVSQRSAPAMATVTPLLRDGGLRLERGASVCEVATPAVSSQRVRVTVWKDSFDALDAGDCAASWLSQQLGREVRLVAFADDVRRDVDARYATDAHTGFADGYPLLVTNEASLDALNVRLPAAIPMARFRPNLVVRSDDAWAEDTWRQLDIDGVRFDGVKPCARCAIINVDQTSGEKPDGDAPLKTLGEVHAIEGRGAIFGMNLVHRGTGVVRVGAQVTIG